MAWRTSFLILILASLGAVLFATNQADVMSTYASSLVSIAVAVGTITALSLAVGSLRSISFLYITRSAGITLAVATALISPPVAISLTVLFIGALHLFFYSEKLITRFTIDSSMPNEQVFILRSPYSVILWFSCAWVVMWATLLEAVHLSLESLWILAITALVVTCLIFGIFIASQMRILLRRCVIVPQGIVVSDLISLTDVVLFPLAKISTVSTHAFPATTSDETFSSTHTHGNIVEIQLTQSTDSLIVRDFVNESARKNVNKIIISIASPQLFVSTFHDRFHHVDAPELSRSEEIMAEKELGIETAPRSDEKLPTWRKKK
jgi:hypothetical protein